MASKQDYSNFVTELNQSSLKPCPEDGRYGAFMRGKIPIYVRALGLKKGEGVCLKGTYFWKFTAVLLNALKSGFTHCHGKLTSMGRV